MFLIFLFLVLLMSFYLLAKVCDEYFVESLDKIADKLKMSSDVAGATLMAIGSSAPELFVAIMSLLKQGDHEAIGAGTIVGSAIFNILVIIGASAVVKRAVLTWQPVVRDALFYSLSIILMLFAFRDGTIVLQEAFYFVFLYVIYVLAVMNWRKILPYKDVKIVDDFKEEVKKDKESKWKSIVKPLDKILEKIFPSHERYYLVFFVSIAIIALLSWVLVESAVLIAGILNIPEAIVALTILAAGTSVPDLISSMIVARQGKGGMAISNAIGSNIFDILVGLGVPWLLILIFSDSGVLVSSENLTSSIFLLFATVLAIFFLLIAKKWKIGRRSGWVLIGSYVVYLIWMIEKTL